MKSVLETGLRGTALADHLNAAIAAGRTVWIFNHLRAWEISPKTAARWEAIGRPIFKASADGRWCLMGSGRKYLAIDGNGWRIV